MSLHVKNFKIQPDTVINLITFISPICYFNHIRDQPKFANFIS